VYSLVLEVAFLVGDMGDEFFVKATTDIGQIDNFHHITPLG